MVRATRLRYPNFCRTSGNRHKNGKKSDKSRLPIRIKTRGKNVNSTKKGASSMGKPEDQVIEVLQKSGKPLTLVEIAEQVGKPPKKVFSLIRKLFESGRVACDHQNHTYTLAKEQNVA